MTIPAVSLTIAKAHLRVDGDAEDDLILGLCEAAADYVCQYCGPTLLTRTEVVEDEEVTTLVPSVRQAMLLLIGDWYRGRENSSDRALSEMPHGVAALLTNYRSYGTAE